jgi:hypothetical protein
MWLCAGTSSDGSEIWVANTLRMYSLLVLVLLACCAVLIAVWLLFSEVLAVRFLLFESSEVLDPELLFSGLGALALFFIAVLVLEVVCQ